MPGIFYQPVSRRNFLKLSAQAGVLVASLNAFGEDAVLAPRSFRIALISDTHLPAKADEKFRGFFPAENLKKILPDIIDFKPEAVIHDGDIARLTGEVADYEAFKQATAALAEKAPIFMGMGNHDNRDNFYKVFESSPGERQKISGKHVLIAEFAPVRMIILDSLFTASKSGGLLGKTQRDWLASYLKSSGEKPIVIFVHHTLKDGDNELLDAPLLLEIVTPHSQVKAIFYGHSHQYAYAKAAHIHLINLPAVGYNFSDSEPVGWVTANFTDSGVDLTLHAIGGHMADDGKTTELRWS